MLKQNRRNYHFRYFREINGLIPTDELLEHAKGYGDFCLLYQQVKPLQVIHVELPKTKIEFDNILGFYLR